MHSTWHTQTQLPRSNWVPTSVSSSCRARARGIEIEILIWDKSTQICYDDTFSILLSTLNMYRIYSTSLDMNVSHNTCSWIQPCRFRHRSRIVSVTQCDTGPSENYMIHHDARNRHHQRSFSQLTRFREYETWQYCPNLMLKCRCLRQGDSEVHGYLIVSGGRRSINHPSAPLPYLLHLCTGYNAQYHRTPKW